MDFMKWLTALDEALYEVMSWLLFFPLTLRRAMVRPLGMMDYAERQLALSETEQYASALSPPLFLALAILLAHGIAATLGRDDAIIASHRGLAKLVSDDIGLVVLRVLIFASFPLFAAARLVRRSRRTLDRASLRAPFYAQCYPAAVFGLTMGIGTALIQIERVRPVGATLLVAGIIWLGVVEARWFAARLLIGRLSAAVAAIMGLAEGLGVLIVAAVIFAA